MRQHEETDNREGDNLFLIRDKWSERNKRKKEFMKLDKANLVSSQLKN